MADRQSALPRFSVCQFTTPDLSFEQDLALFAQIEADGVSICEVKLRDGEDERQLEAFRRSGLGAAICIPVNIGVLTCEPDFPGPEKIEDRIEAMCESIRRLARFEPASIVVITGSPRGRDPKDARRIAVEGLREAARVASELGVRLSIEPLRTDGGLDLTIVSTIPETLELIAEIGAPNVDIAYDVYHLWDTPDVLELTERNAHTIGGVHVCDWREPPRGTGDRLLPGEGTIDLPAIFAALRAGGYDGWYDLEIFSAKTLPDSLWNRRPEDLVRQGRDGFVNAWQTAAQAPSGSR